MPGAALLLASHIIDLIFDALFFAPGAFYSFGFICLWLDLKLAPVASDSFQPNSTVKETRWETGWEYDGSEYSEDEGKSLVWGLVTQVGDTAVASPNGTTYPCACPPAFFLRLRVSCLRCGRMNPVLVQMLLRCDLRE